MSKFDAKKVKDEIVAWIRNWFNSNGKDCVVVVGISGGKDSSVVAALCVEALGKDRVFGVLMPQGKQKDIDYSYKLCNFLDIKHISVHIGITVNSLQNEIAISLKKPLSTQTTTNLPARIRMTTLYAVAQTINGRVANTCNLSETLLSWETRWGDQVGDFSPLADLTVQEVKAIGYELGLPECLIEKTPSDGLCGSSDEEALGFTYAVVDKYIRTGKIDDLDVKSKIDERVTKYRFKRLELPHYESGLKRYID
ncbi:NAD(+) synthase [Faecalibacillus intestinalis]|uniref:NAD(+) synthase n=1 Tax=Faecalibacillus intestinalis TaxID=1982626 RepID=UPI002E7945FC|nr:NAD(+) synthase [Faecalibacillus intestinalis]MEE1447418.1 NAD(+) synthase [Faecalibacillus intestinalis]